MQHHLETFLADTAAADPHGEGVPRWVEDDFRAYLRCGILAHAFARIRCDACAVERLVAFSCKGRGVCPSCNARRMVEVAAPLADHVLPPLPVRQWVLSLPKRIRPFLPHDPRLAGDVLRVLLRAIRTTLRRGSPGAAGGAQLGAVSFVRAGGTDPLSLLPEVRAALGRLDSGLPLYEVDTLDELVMRTRVSEGGFAVLFVAFGVVGLVLAAVGLYGLLSFTVGQRTRELGVRSALGAGPGRIVWLPLRGGAFQLGGGLLVGVLLAAASAPLLGEALMDADPRDPLVYGAVVAVLSTAGLLAALSPARRAVGMDVARSLRSD
ncbi:MAG: transposase zinc-binding domain-containing protein [Gemmatimonadetes bacterium]|nr:transposase zinc-binding domain-containing protein [Gemmatimonadota bacterium]